MKTAKVMTGFAIVVVDKGFVYVGDTTVQDGWVTITGGRNIRVWGTTQGLGELGLKGPTDKTRLDDVPTVRVPVHALIHLIDTEAELWNR